MLLLTFPPQSISVWIIVNNVKIDGKIAEADVDGLDPKIEHMVNMTIKGLSPNGTTSTRDPDIAIAGPFSLINYTLTAVDEP
ncbi:hypothetical protein PQX77_011355 [Marasmius sp. AFHP31]|nr:hypothetical protein PQX77_011355 [Marasmius sp. AFHP31]